MVRWMPVARSMVLPCDAGAVDADLARRLVGPEGAKALELAEDQSDPGSLAAATALRREFTPELAAAALEQVTLRRRARNKLGADAGRLFLTADGLEQATRPAVARLRAQMMWDAGVRRVADLTCGLGLDALAMVQAGIDVRALELDPATAVFAEANLAVDRSRSADDPAVGQGSPGPTTGGSEDAGVRGDVSGADGLVPGRAEVIPADATTFTPDDDETVFLDPARRDARGRSWRLEDLTPPWDFVRSHLERGAWAKLGPGLPHREIPETCSAEWIQHDGDLVEVLLRPGSGRAALLLDDTGATRVFADATHAPVRDLGKWVAEPDPALIRSGALGAVADATGLGRIAPDIAYLTGERRIEHPGLTWFEVCEVLPFRSKDLKAWVRENRVGALEIKKRGVDADPATLRKSLRPKGPGAATLIITPTMGRTSVLVVERS